MMVELYCLGQPVKQLSSEYGAQLIAIKFRQICIDTRSSIGMLLIERKVRAAERYTYLGCPNRILYRVCPLFNNRNMKKVIHNLYN
ncbi:hypothetical protein SAMN04488574_12529 [Bacillus sp. 71mf]|nr:hypothetical protein SAMN04488574_12529 [Bacillus sp. 71mf]SFS69100.1 hypothetical protein SAMN04488145_102566 [Bacillus sp. 103mf]